MSRMKDAEIDARNNAGDHFIPPLSDRDRIAESAMIALIGARVIHPEYLTRLSYKIADAMRVEKEAQLSSSSSSSSSYNGVTGT